MAEINHTSSSACSIRCRDVGHAEGMLQRFLAGGDENLLKDVADYLATKQLGEVRPVAFYAR